MNLNTIKERLKNIGLIILVIITSLIAIPVVAIWYGLYLAIVASGYLLGFGIITIVSIVLFIYYLIKGDDKKD